MIIMGLLLKSVILWLCITFYLMLILPLTIGTELYVLLFYYPEFLLLYFGLVSIPSFFVSLVVIAVYYGVKRVWFVVNR